MDIASTGCADQTMNKKNFATGAIAGIWITLAIGCGGSGSSGDSKPVTPVPPAPISNHAIGGSVFGLHGTLVLALNGGNALTLPADGKFAFADTIAAGSTYSVTVQSQPADQMCTVTHGSGTLGDADVANVTVNCSTITRVVGGTVYGLDSAQSLVLQNNDADDLTIDGNGSFVFATPVAQSGAYRVTVLAQPALQTCTVTGGNGTAGTTDIGDIQVICSTNAYAVGGTVSGLSGTVVLQNNGGDDIAIGNDGAFHFATPAAHGAGYDVTIATQPATQICTISNGSGAVNGAAISDIGVHCVTNTTLTASVADLALSATGLTEFDLSGSPASGAARTITITNTGSMAAFHVAITPPVWPAGTTSSANCGSMLAPMQSCSITVTPGAVATSDGTNPCSTGTAPIPGAIQIAADNTNTILVNVAVLSYGCIYQGGHVYALDDTGPTGESVGGKVAATSDQASVLWSSNGTSAATDAIYGTAETSTSSSPVPASGQVGTQHACNGASDGACNTENIYGYYQAYAAGAPINPFLYAAGACTATIGGYSDWYLPAICEMGYGSTACGSSGSPRNQNMQSNLVDFNGLGLLTGTYWSSTSFSAVPSNNAWSHIVVGGGHQVQASKFNVLTVRCSRTLNH